MYLASGYIYYNSVHYTQYTLQTNANSYVSNLIHIVLKRSKALVIITMYKQICHIGYYKSMMIGYNYRIIGAKSTPDTCCIDEDDEYEDSYYDM